MTKWQPLNTAPTDGAPIIGYCVEGSEPYVGVAYRWVHVGLGLIVNGHWKWSEGQDWPPATHWIPCPEPPRLPR
jgi:hypothetical protein